MSRVRLQQSVPYQDLVKPPEPLPHNMDAEQGLLGALLLNNRGLERVSDFLKPEHFYAPVHARIFEAITQVVDRGQNASPVTLKGLFDADADLEALGGAAYLADLAANVISLVNTEDYGRTLYELYLRRALLELAEDVATAARDYSLDHSAQDTIEATEASLYALAEQGPQQRGFLSLETFANSAVSQAEKAFQSGGTVTGVTTGFRSIDHKLGGFQPSDLIILAGRPSMGKTALAVNIGFNAAKAHAETAGREGAVVGFFSLEMSGDQLAARVLADLSDVPSDSVRRGSIRADDLKAFASASRELANVPLYIDETGAISMAALRSRARRLKRQKGLSLIIVDYLQQISGSGSRQAANNRVVEVSEITRGLKALAKELGVPILALSQLSRAVEQREEKRPQLSDLRESGSIEQDADVVMFVYREEYYLSRSEPQLGTESHLSWQEAMAAAHNAAEAIIAKQRHGSIGTIKLNFDPAFTRFSEADAA